MRVFILHDVGGNHASRQQVSRTRSSLNSFPTDKIIGAPFPPAPTKVLQKLFRKGGVCITTYESVRMYQDLILDRKWGYAVLDEVSLTFFLSGASFSRQ